MITVTPNTLWTQCTSSLPTHYQRVRVITYDPLQNRVYEYPSDVLFIMGGYNKDLPLFCDEKRQEVVRYVSQWRRV